VSRHNVHCQALLNQSADNIERPFTVAIMSNKRVRFSVEEQEEHCLKRLRFMDPDVKVIVGGKVFLHYSMVLCNASEYFDAMLSSAMKEGQTKVIEFPDKQPDEWEEVYAFLGSPGKADLLTEKGATAMIPWFSELRMVDLVSRCDRVFKDSMVAHKRELDGLLRQPRPARGTGDVEKGTCIVKKALENLEISLFYELPLSAKEGLVFLESVLDHHLHFFDENSVFKFVRILRENEAACEGLWVRCIKPLLHASVHQLEGEELMKNPLLGNVILLKAKLAFSQKTQFRGKRHVM